MRGPICQARAAAACVGACGDESEDAAEQRDWLVQGLRQLPQDQRTSLELAYYLGYSCEEIAQIMDCGVPAVKCRMLRAREKLRVSLPRLAGNIATTSTRPSGLAHRCARGGDSRLVDLGRCVVDARPGEFLGRRRIAR